MTSVEAHREPNGIRTQGIDDLKKLASDLRIAANSFRPPIDIIRVASVGEFVVESSNDFDQKSIFGVIDGSDKTITVNETSDPAYQAFAIAYLIGRYNINKNATYPDAEGRLLSATIDELKDDADQATLFAKELLIPSGMISKYGRTFGTFDQGFLSDVFVAPKELIEGEH